MKKIGIVLTVIAACAYAKPTKFQAVHGQATFSQTDNMSLVHVKEKAVIHWDQFSINAGETLSFQFESKKGAVLNRVTTDAKSQILGQLESNGKVFIINKNGVLIGPNANIRTAGFLATTGHIDDKQFLSGGELLLTGMSDEKGRITNLGKIECQNGDIWLVSKRTFNGGTLSAPDGHVGIAMGKEVLIKPDGVERIFIRPDIDGRNSKLVCAIDNRGVIEALITELKTDQNPYAQAINHSGTIKQIERKENQGRVYLVAKGASVSLKGKIQAPGSEVIIDGKTDIILHSKADIDVSHRKHPGSVYLGNETTETVRINQGSKIAANAMDNGDGGRIVLMSSARTIFEGEMTAEALGAKGNGGFIEISSKGDECCIRGKTSLKAVNGQDGKLFIDPKMVNISSNGTDPSTGNTFGSDSSETVTISGNDLSAALNSASVVIQANSDITINDEITCNTSGNGLTLQAGRNITLNSNTKISLNNAPLTITLNDENAIPSDRMVGAANFFAFGPVMIETQGGDITFNTGTFDYIQQGTMVFNQTVVNAGGGSISIDAYGCPTNARGLALNIAEGTEIKTSGTGTIDILATATAGSSNSYGIFSTGGTSQPNKIAAVDGDITITGIGNGTGTGYNNTGCLFSDTQITATGSGGIVINGTGGAGINQDVGIVFSGSQTVVETGSANIQVTGQGNGSGEFNSGICLDSGAVMKSVGAGNITVNGTGGTGTNCNFGVLLLGVGTQISSQGGNISSTANANGVGYYNQGFHIESGANISTTASGTINISGSAPPEAPGTGKYCNGIYVAGATTRITSVNGNLTLTGVGSGSVPYNPGVTIEYPAAVQTTGIGVVIIDSTP